MTSIFLKLPLEVEKFFPFEKLRPGQSMLAKEIYYSVLSRKNVVIEASNGPLKNDVWKWLKILLAIYLHFLFF